MKFIVDLPVKNDSCEEEKSKKIKIKKLSIQKKKELKSMNLSIFFDMYFIIFIIIELNCIINIISMHLKI